MFSWASVFINEIAWTGTSISANDEWMELYNSGTSTVDLSDWTLVAIDDFPTVTLSGTIGPGGFFLLERTDDSSVSSVTADLIYTGALSNTSETLVLSDSDGNKIDYVESGSGWENVGGDNTTKHTAQRQSDGSWITGEPTPRATNRGRDTYTARVPLVVAKSTTPEPVPVTLPVEDSHLPTTTGYVHGSSSVLESESRTGDVSLLVWVLVLLGVVVVAIGGVVFLREGGRTEIEQLVDDIEIIE